ncbi:MAG: sortase B protein-sorting domain-containing protein [Dorea sp.]|nr:sortase B protein-sorting domain-containing protein [Dorea sp.]
MKKRWIALSLAGVLALVSSVTTLAEDRKGASGWQVSFDGSKITNNFSKSDMDDEIYAMEPGDSVELTISLKNSFNGQADWYMRNQVLETLEKSAEIAGGAYDYLLTYKDASGATTTLYSSEKFGGEGRYNGVGLKGATTTLDEYFYLDRLGKEDTGVVKLKVALDGETLVNSYQSTLAVLQMDFATELVKSGTSTQTPGRNREIIKTGDQSQIMLYILLALGSGLLLLMLAFLRMRREKEEPVWETETDCKKEAEIV